MNSRNYSGQHFTDPIVSNYDMVSVGSGGTMRTTLTISDIQKLAQAGVTMTFDQIADQVRPDPPQQQFRMVDCNYLLQPIIERWKMAHTPNMFPGEGRYPNMFLSAAKHGEKVYVFAATLSHEPMIIEDDAAIYPSDALMAKLAMLEKMDSEKSGGPVQTAQAVHAQQARMRIP